MPELQEFIYTKANLIDQINALKQDTLLRPEDGTFDQAVEAGDQERLKVMAEHPDATPEELAQYYAQDAVLREDEEKLSKMAAPSYIFHHGLPIYTQGSVVVPAPESVINQYHS